MMAVKGGIDGVLILMPAGGRNFMCSHYGTRLGVN
jgi:hypothetical protein